jgi:hypothetical protein
MVREIKGLMRHQKTPRIFYQVTGYFIIILRTLFGGLSIQISFVVKDGDDVAHLATCFGPKDAIFTLVTIGENFNPLLRESLIENKRSWARRDRAQMCWYFSRIDRS